MTVHLVGAGPGDPELLTLRAARLLGEADVVVHDRLVGEGVLELANPKAEFIDVGKVPGRSHSQELINELLVALGREHACVVRLKGGDPFVFGRGGEELEALANAGIHAEVVPGVTSALSGPLAAGIPVTHRGASHGVLVVTGHAEAGRRVDFTQLANPDLSVVILMGVGRRGEIAAELMDGGLVGDTPVAVVESAWTAKQRVVRGELQDLAQLEVNAPAIIVVGAVAALDLASPMQLAAALG